MANPTFKVHFQLNGQKQTPFDSFQDTPEKAKNEVMKQYSKPGLQCIVKKIKAVKG